MQVEESLVYKWYPCCNLCYSSIYTIHAAATAKHLVRATPLIFFLQLIWKILWILKGRIYWPGNLLLHVVATIISFSFFPLFFLPISLSFYSPLCSPSKDLREQQSSIIAITSCPGSCLNGIMICWKWYSFSHVLDNLHTDFKFRCCEASQRQVR